MALKTKRQFKNRLALARRRKSMEQKQVAILLGHKNTEQISRYENGVKVPNLKAALKLATIYKIPIRWLLDEYYQACLKEIRRQEKAVGTANNFLDGGIEAKSQDADFCSFETRLRSANVEPIDLDKASRHSTDLIRLRAERLDHF